MNPFETNEVQQLMQTKIALFQSIIATQEELVKQLRVQISMHIDHIHALQAVLPFVKLESK